MTKASGVLAEFTWLRPIVKALPLRRVREFGQVDDRLQEYGRVAVLNAKSRNLSKANVFSRILAHSDSDKSG